MTLTTELYIKAASPLTIEQIARLRGIYRELFDTRFKPSAKRLTISKLSSDKRTFLYIQLVGTYGEDSSLAKMVKSYGINEL